MIKGKKTKQTSWLKYAGKKYKKNAGNPQTQAENNKHMKKYKTY